MKANTSNGYNNFSAIWAFFYLVASSCVASLWHVPAAPTVFGFLTCPLYIALVSCISIKKAKWKDVLYSHTFPGKPGRRGMTRWIMYTQVNHLNTNTLRRSNCLVILIRVSEYDPSSVSYQNSEPSYGSRPGTAPGLPAPHQADVLKVPQVTVTSPGNNARLELVD